jgi:hypothetical protein
VNQNCAPCVQIRKFEESLDVRAQDLVRKVEIFVEPVRGRNNARWQRFAQWCRLPLVGDFIYRRRRMPSGLEQEPSWFDEPWYKKEGADIEAAAQQLERMKADHMGHWGDEIVSPCDYSDPGGYYTPSRTSRNKCYHKWHLMPFVPDKYDFSTGAGVAKMQASCLVLCANTKRLVSMAKCNWRVGLRTGWKVIFWLRGTPRMPYSNRMF